MLLRLIYSRRRDALMALCLPGVALERRGFALAHTRGELRRALDAIWRGCAPADLLGDLAVTPVMAHR